MMNESQRDFFGVTTIAIGVTPGLSRLFSSWRPTRPNVPKWNRSCALSEGAEQVHPQPRLC
jgi:hypothetical protein